MELILGNALEHLDKFKDCDAIVSDPPYGVKINTNYKRFTGSKKPCNKFSPVIGDDEPFDPTPWIGFPKVVLFGCQYFADKLPIGTTLVWIKKRDPQFGTFLSDAELAWMKGGKGVFCFRHVWSGFDRESERGQKTLHPCQKPVELLKAIIERLKLPPGSKIGDPYLGSGATGVAAVSMGFDFVGAEIDPDYFAIAKERIEKASNPA